MHLQIHLKYPKNTSEMVTLQKLRITFEISDNISSYYMDWKKKHPSYAIFTDGYKLETFSNLIEVGIV